MQAITDVFITDARTLFDYFWTVEKKTPVYSHSNAWESKEKF